MNIPWALDQLNEFIRLTESRNQSSGLLLTARSHSIHPRADVLSQWAVVQPILDAVYPKWGEEHSLSMHYEFSQRRDAAIHARTLVMRAEEIRQNLKPEGPVLSSEELHPVIWDPASLLWRDNHHRSAVQAASSSLDAYLQDFVSRSDISGRELVNESFSEKPPSLGKSRIIVPQQINKETTQSLQQGMRALGEACFAIVRNLSTHGLADMSEQEGLEQLAMLSLFAHLLDTCSLKLADSTPVD